MEKPKHFAGKVHEKSLSKLCFSSVHNCFSVVEFRIKFLRSGKSVTICKVRWSGRGINLKIVYSDKNHIQPGGKALSGNHNRKCKHEGLDAEGFLGIPMGLKGFCRNGFPGIFCKKLFRKGSRGVGWILLYVVFLL